MLNFSLLVLAFVVILFSDVIANEKFVAHYVKLNYDVQNTRNKRSIEEYDHVVPINYKEKKLTLKLKRAADSVFDSNANVDNLDHLVDGLVDGDPHSQVYGSMLDGIFDGHIYLGDGTLYHVDKASKFMKMGDSKPINYHSIIYDDRDIDFEAYNEHRRKRAVDGPHLHETCGLNPETARRMMDTARNGENQAYSWSASEDQAEHDSQESVKDRYKRQTNGVREESKMQDLNGRRVYDVRMCSLYMQADQYLYNEIYEKEGLQSYTRTREEINSLFYTHVKTVNKIYEKTSFDGIIGVNFIIQRTTIYDPASCESGSSENPFCVDNVDVSNYLNLNSISNHSAFCLAYALTYRDFDSGTLGLAWVASPQPNTAGGICQVYQRYNERRGWVWRSLNTGIITLVNYGHRVPSRVSQLTLAHEIGHNFGSPHDYPEYCQPGLPDGNFIMYASATSGDKKNNEEFSPCSKANISAVLYAVLAETPVDPQRVLYSPSGGKRNCFSARTTAFCGNQIVEPGEMCDCGFEQADCDRMQDACCNPHKTTDGSAGCTRKSRAHCSPSEGPCCDPDTCNFKPITVMCSEADDCNNRQACNGHAAQCPPPPHKADGTTCKEATKVCSAGVCNRSICLHVGLEDCFITEASPEAKCMLACKENNVCKSSAELPQLQPYYKVHMGERHDQHVGHSHANAKGIELRPGSPCDDYRGYCDILRKCRSVDSDGALSKLREVLFNEKTFNSVRDWTQQHWWAVPLIGLALILLMALFIKCCAVHTPSTNPNKPPAHNIYETLRHPTTLIGRGRTPRERTPRTGGAQSRSRSRRPRDSRQTEGQQPTSSNSVNPSQPTVPQEPPPPYLAVDLSQAGLPKRGHRKNRNVVDRRNLVELQNR